MEPYVHKIVLSWVSTLIINPIRYVLFSNISLMCFTVSYLFRQKWASYNRYKKTPTMKLSNFFVLLIDY